ncbi:CopD family protein [Gammaproteobacteria bacterium AH-315-E17]|nr:CopD family protein [Gammaproteobacteria bacterium AH-315-E17]
MSSLLAKAFILIALASVIGGAFCLLLSSHSALKIRRHLYNYVAIGALVGFFASGLYFFVQIGAINQSGLSGMLDRTMISILAQSGLGYASLIRVIAFFMIVIFFVFKTRFSKSEALNFGGFSILFFSIAMLLLVYSFSLIGHVTELQFLAGVAVGLHILAVSLWVGSLYPLWYLCKLEKVERLQQIMRRFGELAMVFVGLLILSGVFLLTQLLEAPIELISTSYGLTLLFKLTGVVALLSLGAINKLRLVPGLTHAKGVIHLQNSIALEIALAFVVLMITAYLTTLVGLGHSG